MDFEQRSLQHRPEGRPRQDLAGEVIGEGIGNSRAIYRFVQKRINQWIAGRWPGATRSACYFHVIFEREGTGHLIGCVARVRVNDALWTGAQYGESFSEALIQSLAHMTAVLAAAPAPTRLRPKANQA